MTIQHPREVGQEHVVARYVSVGNRYLSLQGGNFLRLGDDERTAFTDALRSDAVQVSAEEIEALLGYEWRARLTAAWMIGITRRTEWRERLGDMLLASELTCAGEGYCYALARFGEHRDAEILVSYLQHYLPRLEDRYDQGPALDALLRLDSLLGASYAEQFTAPGGVWERWVDALPHTRGTSSTWAAASREAIDTWCGFWDV